MRERMETWEMSMKTFLTCLLYDVLVLSRLLFLFGGTTGNGASGGLKQYTNGALKDFRNPYPSDVLFQSWMQIWVSKQLPGISRGCPGIPRTCPWNVCRRGADGDLTRWGSRKCWVKKLGKCFTYYTISSIYSHLFGYKFIFNSLNMISFYTIFPGKLKMCKQTRECTFLVYLLFAINTIIDRFLCGIG